MGYTMETEVKEAIEKNLSSEVGDILKERLQKAEKDEGELVCAREEIRKDRMKIAELEKSLHDLRGLEMDEGKIKAKVIELDKESAILKVEKENAGGRVRDMKEFVLAVFANNRFKHSVNGVGPAGIDRNGYAQSANISKQVEGEE